jgi:hypothetical protein
LVNPGDLFQEDGTPIEVMSGLSIDNLIFGLDGNKLKVLLVKHRCGIRSGEWALPGGFLNKDEDLRDGAQRLLENLTGVAHPYLEQLKAFGKVDRYPLERVVTIAYYALVSADDYALVAGLNASDAAWFDARQTPNLVFDHNDILSFGVSFLQQKIRREWIGFNLLPEKFTLLQLQELYEAVLDLKLDKPNFRRKIMKMGLLQSCDEKQKGVAHRAANLYRFDKDAYDQLTEAGLIFDA